MRTTIVMAALLAAASYNPTFAADVFASDPAPIVETTVPPAEPWSGFQIGALLGYSWSSNAGIDGNGLDGGIYGGYDSQIGQYVLGLEADALLGGVSASGIGHSQDQNWSGSLRARAGIALDRYLLYATGGLAATGAELSSPAGSDTNTLWGWTLGAGAEALLGEALVARVEYRYADYENTIFSLGGTSATSDLDTHSVRAGIGVKF